MPAHPRASRRGLGGRLPRYSTAAVRLYRRARPELELLELPSTSRSGVPGPVEEIIHLQFFSRDGRRRWGSVSVAGTLPRPKTEPREYEIEDNEPETTESAGSDDAEGSRWLLAGEKVEELIGRHFDLINSLYDQPVADGWRWEGDVQGMAVRPLGRVLERWGAIGDTGEPRLSLIVSLARELPPILEVLCEHPRHVLGRVRTMQPLDRVQELDGMCLRWLARQPGRRVIEKAGVSQRVLGIARVEVVDTLENRVLRDLMRRAMLACRRYQAEYGHIDHERVRLVREFRHQLRRLLHHSAVAGVRALPGVPRPNYVLQQDSRYRIIWAAYLRLVRQETMLDDAWRWRQRIWVEDCGLAITTALAEPLKTRSGKKRRRFAAFRTGGRPLLGSAGRDGGMELRCPAGQWPSRPLGRASGGRSA